VCDKAKKKDRQRRREKGKENTWKEEKEGLTKREGLTQMAVVEKRRMRHNLYLYGKIKGTKNDRCLI